MSSFEAKSLQQVVDELRQRTDPLLEVWSDWMKEARELQDADGGYVLKSLIGVDALNERAMIRAYNSRVRQAWRQRQEKTKGK